MSFGFRHIFFIYISCNFVVLFKMCVTWLRWTECCGNGRIVTSTTGTLCISSSYFCFFPVFILNVESKSSQSSYFCETQIKEHYFNCPIHSLLWKINKTITGKVFMCIVILELNNESIYLNSVIIWTITKRNF